MSNGGSFLEKLGLHRPELRAWAMYDWANSAFLTVIVTAVFPIYYSKVAAEFMSEPAATFRFSMATTIALVLIAVASPILGATVDFVPIKKRLLGMFMAIGAVAVSCMFFVVGPDWLLLLFVIGNIAANGSFVFYDSLLPHVAEEDELDRVSTAGYALGYLGGGFLLGASLACIMRPDWFGLPHGEAATANEQTLPTRLSFVAVAVWWVVFSIPLFVRVPEPKPELEPDEYGGGNPVRMGLVRLWETFRELRRFRHAFVMLVAFFIYNDGIGTIIRMAALYGATIGIGQEALISAILVTQFVGIPFAFLFGRIAGWIGTRAAIFIGLAVYCGISVFGYFMQTGAHFLILAITVGMVQGGTQALSRSLFATLIPRYKSGQFFGLFAVVEKFAGIMGPMLFGFIAAATGSNRNAILGVIALFIVGGLLLCLVNVDEGRRIAREDQARARPQSPQSPKSERD